MNKKSSTKKHLDTFWIRVVAESLEGRRHERWLAADLICITSDSQWTPCHKSYANWNRARDNICDALIGVYTWLYILPSGCTSLSLCTNERRGDKRYRTLIRIYSMNHYLIRFAKFLLCSRRGTIIAGSDSYLRWRHKFSLIVLAIPRGYSCRNFH